MNAIAIVSAALRLPGADSLDAYWRVLSRDHDSITRTDDAVPPTGEAAAFVPRNARFVGAYGALDGVSLFDHERFGMSAAEALRTDPQQRLLLEVVDEALHGAAVPAALYATTAVFIGTGLNTYEQVVRARLAGLPGLDDFAVELGTARDYAAGKIAYQLDLRGPVANVLAACSTGLVALHLGCRAVSLGEADVAVIGVSAVRFPEWSGYWAAPGTISSPDGFCRPFDARATGTVPADGVGALVLRRLEDAQAAGDDVLAVIRGSAVNNDGRKPGFGSVSASSQQEVIRAALRAAEVDPADVSYVESHGTATRLGDAVEWATLQRIFGANDAPVNVGAVKGNIGHTREAAGLASLLKAMLSLRHGTVPATANFTAMPSDLRLADSPVQPVPAPTPLKSSSVVGVSAFGLGGTNCHVVLTAAPEPTAPSEPAAGSGVVLLSSHRPDTLEADTSAARVLVEQDTPAASRLAARSQRRAHRHAWRRYVSLDDATGAAAGFATSTLGRTTAMAPKRPAELVFAFSGAGGEYVGMGAEMAALSEVFAESLARTVALAEAAGTRLGPVFVPPAPTGSADDEPVDLRRLVGRGRSQLAGTALSDVPVRHLALFAVQLAYVDLFEAAGIRPAAVIGHSLGEWTAATVAGALRREDAIRLVARRAALIARAPRGVTIAVAAGADAVRPLLAGTGVIVAADNSPQSCTISGPPDRADDAAKALRDAGLIVRPVAAEAAFHNPSLQAAATDLAAELRNARFTDPVLPMASALTAGWLTAGDLGPAYWQAQLVEPVRFREALAVTAERYDVLIEMGPGSVRPWAQQTAPALDAIRTAKTSYEGARERDIYEQALARLWLHGHDPRWPSAAEPQAAPGASDPVPALHRTIFDPETASHAPSIAADRPTAPTGATAPDRRAADPGLAAFTQWLAEVWSALLGRAETHEHDHFFDVGGDSLLGRHLIAMIEERTGVQVPGTVVFASGSLGGMARGVHKWISDRLESDE